MSDKVFKIDDYRPHINVTTDDAVHVYPVAYFQSLIAGDEDAEPLDKSVWLSIMAEWAHTPPGGKRVFVLARLMASGDSPDEIRRTILRQWLDETKKT